MWPGAKTGPLPRAELHSWVIRKMGETGQHWFEPIAEHLGAAYLRYSFTKGTVQEVEYLIAALGLTQGDRVLDVGCGPGRHSHALAERGIAVHGIDISQRFVDLAAASAPSGATFARMDARDLFDTSAQDLVGAFDAVICLCQGAFGLMTRTSESDTDDDGRVLAGIARCLKPGGRLALSAFNAYFAVKYHTDATFDAAYGISHERTEIRDEQGQVAEVDLWTGCYTPRELRLMMASVGLVVDRINSVEPGAYGEAFASVESPEFLVVAHRSR
jgi:2-polyprenyl-3-methyl-5-hydroxy-6-metoxy-1,4-benzoquinol methylase